MTWEDVTVPAVGCSAGEAAHVRFSAGDVCVVEVRIGDDLYVQGEAHDLFEALALARRELEAHGVLLALNGSRTNVFPSPMLRQGARGRYAYELAMPRSVTKPPTVDIFAPVPESSALASVEDQRAWFDEWLRSKPVEGALS